MIHDEPICPDCNEKILADNRRCPKCGCPLDANSPRRTGLLGLTVALFVVAVVAGTVYLKRLGISHDDTPKQFYERAEQLADETPVRPVGVLDLGQTTVPMALSSDWRTSAWGYGGHDVLMANVGQRLKPFQRKGHSAPITAIGFSPVGDILATGDARGEVRVWMPGTSQLRVLSGHAEAITAVAFSRDDELLATASQDHSLRLWHVSTGEQLIAIDEHDAPVTAVAFDLSGRALASAGGDNMIRVWNLENGRESYRIKTGAASIRRMLFSPDDETLISVDEDNSIELWNLRTRERRLEIKSDVRVLAMAVSFDGSMVASSTIDQCVTTWDASTGERIRRTRKDDPVVFLSHDRVKNEFVELTTSTGFLINVGAKEIVKQAMKSGETIERAIAGFQSPHDCEVALFAAEPMVAYPTDISFDNQGRLFVAESFRFKQQNELSMTGREFWLADDLASQTTDDRLRMYKKWADKNYDGMAAHTRFSERIRRLHDTDNDGRADRVTVFSEGYNTPLTGSATGLLVHEGQVYFACIPNLWHLADDNDDGRADRRTSLHEGFGVCASLPHGLHGLLVGPDGKLYFSVGDRGYHVETKEGKILHNPGRGAIFRCNLDGSELEEFAIGLRNTQDMSFDQFGNLITCDNNVNSGDQSRLIYVVKGGDYGWHYASIRREWEFGPWYYDKLWQTRTEGQAAWVIPPIAHLSTGPSGMDFDPGVGLPERFHNHFFLCDYVFRRDISGIMSFSLRSQGAGFELGESKVFMSNILASDVEFGFDGKMYVADWVRGYGSGGVGRIYAVDFPACSKDGLAALFAESFDDKSIEELTELLRHDDRRLRQKAHLALAERGAESIDALSHVAASEEKLLARIHAIWSLGIIARQDRSALAPLAGLLQDPHHEVRVQAAKVIGESNQKEHSEKLAPLLNDAEPRVRYFAAMALGDLKHTPAVEDIIELARSNDDQDIYLRHAAVYALHKMGDLDSILSYAGDSSRSVRMTILLVLRRLGDHRVSRFLDDSDPDLVVEAARAIHDLPIQSAYPALAALIERDNRSLSDSEGLGRRVINANFRLGGQTNALALVHFAARPDHDLEMRIEALKALADWITPPPRDRVTGYIRPLPIRQLEKIRDAISDPLSQLVERSNDQLRREAIRVAGRLQIQPLVADVLDRIADETLPLKTRVAAIRQFADFESRRDEAITAGLETDEPLIRAEAAALLAITNPTQALGEIRKALGGGSIAGRQKALATLAEIEGVDADKLLSRWLYRLMDGEVPASLRADLVEAVLKRDDSSLKNELQIYLSQQQGASFDVEMLSTGGDAERGRAIFFDPARTQCVRCHKIAEQGGVVGPDLTKIGSKHPRDYLIASLRTPNSDIAKGYEGIAVTTVDGKVYQGVLKSEDEESILVVTAKGEEQTIAKADVDDRSTGKSVMPADLTERLSLFELRDLVEYLASRK